MKSKSEGESWFEFMTRAKQNGISPTTQEQIDKSNKPKQEEINETCQNCTKTLK